MNRKSSGCWNPRRRGGTDLLGKPTDAWFLPEERVVRSVWSALFGSRLVVHRRRR